jgi:tetratricopeptide (TPR) repeat protein
MYERFPSPLSTAVPTIRCEICKVKEDKIIATSVIIFLFIATIFCKGAVKGDLDSLDYYLTKQKEYDRIKEERINRLKEKIYTMPENPLEKYSLYEKLFEEYRSYIYDSAYVYVEKLLSISKILNDPEKITSSQVKLGFCYLSSGLFKECFDILSVLDVKHCTGEVRIDYYITKSRLYYDLADYNKSPEFRKKYEQMGNAIIDSAIALLPVESPRFWSSVGLKKMKSDNKREAPDAFMNMINTRNYSDHDLAIATSSIAYLLFLQGEKEKAEEYFIKAAIADIKSSTKEAVALRNLAKLLYEEGNLTRSAEYIRRALDDAYFYNARHRQLEIGYILPIIEGERMNVIQNQKNKIFAFLLLISILLIALIIAFFIIWKQLKRLNQAKQII